MIDRHSYIDGGPQINAQHHRNAANWRPDLACCGSAGPGMMQHFLSWLNRCRESKHYLCSEHCSRIVRNDRIGSATPIF